MDNLLLFDEVKKEVIYSNDFSEVIFTNYNLRHKKLLLLLIAGLNETDKTYTFEGKAIKIAINMERKAYTEFSKLLMELQDKPFLMYNKETEELDRISIFDKITFTRDKKILVTFGNSARKFFLNLKGNFSKFLVKNIENLSISNSIDLYLRAETNLFRNNFYMSIDEIKRYFEVNYQSSKDIEVRIIKPCCKDISENTNINIEYQKIKKGKSIDGYKFLINRNFKISDNLFEAIEKAKKNIYINKSKVLDNEKNIYTLFSEFSEEKLIFGLKYCYQNINKEFKTLTYIKNTIKNIDFNEFSNFSSNLKGKNIQLTLDNPKEIFEEFQKLDDFDKLKIEEKIYNMHDDNEKKILDMYLSKDKNLFYSAIMDKLCKYLIENKTVIITSPLPVKPKKRGRRKKLDMLDELDMEAETTKHEKKIISFMKKQLTEEEVINLLQKNRLEVLSKNYVELLKSKG